MSARTRDTIALFAIASGAILAVLYADADLGAIFEAILSRWLARPTAPRLGCRSSGHCSQNLTNRKNIGDSLLQALRLHDCIDR